MRKVFALLLSLLIFAPSLWAQSNEEATEQMQKLNRFYRYLHGVYVDSLQMAPLVDEAIRAMLAELDPHSTYLDREEMAREQVTMESSFGGIGIEFRVVQDTIRVQNVLTGGAAEGVGLRPGDRIIKIDSRSAVGLKQSEVPDHLRGEAGTRVEVEILRPHIPEPLIFSITRAMVPLHSVSAAYQIDDKTGYIKVDRFVRTTYEEFARAFNRQGKVENLILDLQGNGGGLLQQALALAEFFLDKGLLLLSTEGRAVPEQQYVAVQNGPFRRGRLIVLVDERSASASEIVAGAVQDWDRGLILGRPTFGKGLVQRQIPLGDGSAARITIAHYHTPSGRVIQRPYQRGDREEYYAHYRERLYGEESEPSTNSLPRFTTLRSGRTVYGGGGIRPDHYVAADTSGYTPYLGRLLQRGMVEGYLLETLDRNSDSLQRCYPTYEDLARDFDPAPWIEGLTHWAENAGEAVDSTAVVASHKWLVRHLMTHLAGGLYGAECRSRAWNDAGGNEVLNEAMKWLADPERMEALLQGEGDINPKR